jgi:pyrroloquinoline quinone biosynthesis protein B
MRIHILGSAAGGGLPQWNCACRQCDAARRGEIPARTQSSVAVSADGERWFLINASPDLRAQIGSFPPLQPRPEKPRSTPIQSVLLTGADLDHVIGLLLLREGERLPVHAPPAVRREVSAALGFDRLLSSFCSLEWRDWPETAMSLPLRGGEASGLLVQAIPLGGPAPRYARDDPSAEQHAALEFVDESTKGRALIVPGASEMTPALEAALQRADVILFDGTFWTENEMRDAGFSTLGAADMGHLPVSSGSLEPLRRAPARQKAYFHINNSNPMLLAGSEERKQVEAAGIRIAEDGLEFSI